MQGNITDKRVFEVVTTNSWTANVRFRPIFIFLGNILRDLAIEKMYPGQTVRLKTTGNPNFQEAEAYPSSRFSIHMHTSSGEVVFGVVPGKNVKLCSR